MLFRKSGSRPLLAAAVLFALCSATLAGEKLTLDELKTLLGTERDQSAIVRLVEAADSVEVRKEDLETLRKLGAGEPLLKALSRWTEAGARGFSVQAVLGMLKEGRPKAEVLDYVVSEGVPLALTIEQKLEVKRAGGKEDVTDVILALEGKYVYPEFDRFLPDHRLFSIQYPKGWHVYQWYTDEGLKFAVSPERDLADEDAMTTGVVFAAYVMWPGHPFERLGLIDGYTRAIPHFLAKQHKNDLKRVPGPEGEIVKGKVAGHDALLIRYTVKHTGQPCKFMEARVLAQDIDFSVEFRAPEAEFAEHEAAYRKMLRTFKPFPEERQMARGAAPLDAAALVDRYRESVVQVQARFKDGRVQYGTGFFVREDGYVVTNHHVICRKEEHSGCTVVDPEQLADSYVLVWDSTVGPKEPGQRNRAVDAELVGTVYDTRPWIDLALLRAPPQKDPYRAMPLAPVGTRRPTGFVSEGDPVVALGFPLPDRLGIDRVVHTAGNLAQLQYFGTGFAGGEPSKTLDNLLTTVVVNPGNSGGPLVSQMTGAVVGINVAIQVGGEEMGNLKNQRLGYSSAIAADYALRCFPQIRFYPLNREPPPEGHLQLASMLLDERNDKAALVEIAIALDQQTRLKPEERAQLYYLLATLQFRNGNSERGEQSLQECLRLKPGHMDALVDLAYMQAADRPDLSIGYLDRAIEGSPDQWGPFYHRAEFYRRAGRYADALADVRKAREELGGAYDSSTYRMEGLILYQDDKLEEGRRAYEKAVEQDPSDLQARLGIADYYVRKQNPSSALLEYGRIVQRYPDEPSAFETFGTYLVGAGGQQQEGLTKLVRAIELTIERGDTPKVALLRQVASVAREVPEQGRVALEAALLMYRYHPEARALAHQEIAFFWEKQGALGMARAHHLASEAVEGKELGYAAKLPAAALTLDELCVAIRMGYDPELLSETLRGTSLGFQVDLDKLKQLSEYGAQELHLRLVVGREQLDERNGGPCLAALVQREGEGGVHVDDGTGPWMIHKLTNSGQVPLTGLRAKYRYWEKKSEDDWTLLWEDEADLPLPFGILEPGESRRVRMAWHTWETLAQAGVDPKRLTNYELRIVGARNASYLHQVQVTELAGAEGGPGYTFRLVNGFPYTLTGLQVRCDFQDEQGGALVATSGMLEGRECYDTALFERLSLDPQATSGVLLVDRWGDANYLTQIGVPIDQFKKLTVRVVGAEIVPAEH